jgi:carboxymethylenebutenolidase
MGSEFSIASADGRGSFKAYLAEPVRAARSAIVVIQEIFGVNAGIRSKCDQWAAAGYLALAPDLFWRLEPGIELDPDVPEQMQRGLELMGRFDQQLAIADIDATIRVARGRVGGGSIGGVGFCLGGRLAFMTALETDVDAAVCYYGVGIDGLLGGIARLSHPVLLHVPTADHFVPPAAQQAMHAGLDRNPLVTIYDYPGLDHGFAAQSGRRRNEQAAQLADARTVEFLARHLRGD